MQEAVTFHEGPAHFMRGVSKSQELALGTVMPTGLTTRCAFWKGKNLERWLGPRVHLD